MSEHTPDGPERISGWIEELKTLRAQQDELVEALEGIMKATPHSMCADAEAWAKAEAVLEKVRGEQK